MSKRLIFIILIQVLIVGIGALVFLYLKFFNIQKLPVLETSKVESVKKVEPKQKYEGAYNGTLYLTGGKLGSENSIDKIFKNFDANGITYAIVYFAIEADNKAFALPNIKYIGEMINKQPGRVIPFYSPGFGSEEAEDMLGAELTGIYKNGYDLTNEKLGNVLKGIGEVETQEWQVRHNDPKVLGLIDFASSKNMAVMMHPKPEKLGDMEDILKKYPDTKFLIHLYRPDYSKSKARVVELMEKYPNLYFTIDADHLMFDFSKRKSGLLYEYQDADVDEAVEGFKKAFDEDFDNMLASSLKDFKELAEKFPKRVTVGTEASTEYSLEPEIFDRTIKMLRYFIGSLDPLVQEDIAYKNGIEIFGEGIKPE